MRERESNKGVHAYRPSREKAMQVYPGSCAEFVSVGMVEETRTSHDPVTRRAPIWKSPFRSWVRLAPAMKSTRALQVGECSHVPARRRPLSPPPLPSPPLPGLSSFPVDVGHTHALSRHPLRSHSSLFGCGGGSETHREFFS